MYARTIGEIRFFVVVSRFFCGKPPQKTGSRGEEGGTTAPNTNKEPSEPLSLAERSGRKGAGLAESETNVKVIGSSCTRWGRVPIMELALSWLE